MRQLSLTETNTFVNLAKHALETLNASEDEELGGGVGKNSGDLPHYSDDDADERRDGNVDEVAAASVPPASLKTIRSEPVFKKTRQKRLGLAMGMGQTAEAEEETEMERQWVGPTADAAGDEDMLQFVAHSCSDIEMENVDHRDDNGDAEPSGDETTHLATSPKNLFLC